MNGLMATENDSSILIRDAVPEDINDLVSLLKVLFAIERDFDFDQDKHKKGLAMLLERPREACVIVAETIHVTKTTVGMCTAQRLISTAEGGFAAIVEDVVVKAPFRRQGIAGRMLAAVADWGRKNNINRIQLLYDTSNTAALDFYRAKGWQETALACLREYI